MPMQDVYLDEHGTARFKVNKIVRFLLATHSRVDLNMIEAIPFPQEDREQFYQLLGYSVGGYAEIFGDTDVVKAADEIAAALAAVFQEC